MKDLWIIGAGGHAKAVIAAAQSSGFYRVVGCLDDSPATRGILVEGVQVVGDTAYPTVVNLGVEHAVIAIGNNTMRRQKAEQLKDLMRFETIIHSKSWVAPSAILGQGVVVMPGVVIQPGASIGDHVIVNTSSSIDHDCSVGSYAHLGPGAHLAGHATLEEGVHAQVGVSVMTGITVHSWSILAAGSVVICDVPANATTAGIPGKNHNKREPG